jgi:putative ATP-dependent endonuclease of the OLD family
VRNPARPSWSVCDCDLPEIQTPLTADHVTAVIFGTRPYRDGESTVQIRRIDIANFRGIRRLSWVLPSEQTFFVFVGPGDSTKSTILTAIERTLSDRWNIGFQDTDFFEAGVDAPIMIRIAIGNIPGHLMAMESFGLHLCGLSKDGQLTHDPEGDAEPCIVVELKVEKDLEPQWTAYRPGAVVEAQAIKASLRAHFGAYRIDERIDAHLRWSRTSALGRLTEARHGTKETLTEANRAARKAVADSISPDLAVLASEIQAKMQRLGSGEFHDLKPGLDTSLANTQGNLALFDGVVPLTNFGLGSRRLAGAAAQQLAHEGSALLLVDEVEYGLEPHRLVHLLAQLRDPDAFAQVFITTHAPTALVHLDAEHLVTVRSEGGATTLRHLDNPSTLQGLLRRAPAAFLSCRILVAEGKTEYGVALGLLDAWDHTRVADGAAPSAALGVVAVEGGGGSSSVDLARGLLSLGFEVTLLLDSDVVAVNEAAAKARDAGAFLVQWGEDFNTEAAICDELDVAGLTALIQLALHTAEDTEAAEQSLKSQLLKSGAPSSSDQLNVASWLSDGFDLRKARNAVALAANKRSWFKLVHRGKALADFMLSRSDLRGGALSRKLDLLREGVYGPRSHADAPAAASPSNPPELASLMLESSVLPDSPR